MFETLRLSLKTGVVTTRYPQTPPEISSRARGRPEIDWANWKDARPAAAICPTGAIEFHDNDTTRSAALDLGKCIFCGLCADLDPAIRMTNQCELAARRRASLKLTAKYHLNSDGTHQRLLDGAPAADTRDESLEAIGQQLRTRIRSVLGRSLHIREVDAGSCNGCEVEIHGLNSPVYDLERFGIHFVASPRHADMLLVTGPVTRNMELALRKTYDAAPELGLSSPWARAAAAAASSARTTPRLEAWTGLFRSTFTSRAVRRIRTPSWTAFCWLSIGRSSSEVLTEAGQSKTGRKPPVDQTWHEGSSALSDRP